MALSSSESELLTQTCENMNIAANTCREVLEMLRNLGNTGVVDIATHNNTPGAHANDGTIVHSSDYDTTGKQIHLGNKDGLSFNPLNIYASSELAAKSRHLYTMGFSGFVQNNSYRQTNLYLSDASKNRISFENSQAAGLNVLHTEYFTIFDANDQYVRSGISYYEGKIGASPSAGSVPPYGSVRPFFTVGTMSQFGQTIEFNADGVVPTINNTASLGVSGFAFKDLFLVNQPTVTSDRRAKKDVSALGSQAVDFIKALRPVSYRLKQGEGQIEQFNEDGPIANDTPDREGIRTHWGLIAQEVKEALATAGYEDAALWCLADKDDPDSQQSLRYTELIAPMIKVIQQQQERIEALERKVA